MSDEYWRVWADQAARKPWDEFTEVVMPPLVAERDALKARIELLTAALTDVLANTYRWDTIAGVVALFNARAALAAGETESEAP